MKVDGWSMNHHIHHHGTRYKHTDNDKDFLWTTVPAGKRAIHNYIVQRFGHGPSPMVPVATAPVCVVVSLHRGTSAAESTLHTLAKSGLPNLAREVLVWFRGLGDPDRLAWAQWLADMYPSVDPIYDANTTSLTDVVKRCRQPLVLLLQEGGTVTTTPEETRIRLAFAQQLLAKGVDVVNVLTRDTSSPPDAESAACHEGTVSFCRPLTAFGDDPVLMSASLVLQLSAAAHGAAPQAASLPEHLWAGSGMTEALIGGFVAFTAPKRDPGRWGRGNGTRARPTLSVVAP